MMKQQKTFLISLVLISMLCFLGNIYAMEIAGKDVSVTISDSFVSRYIWRGQDLYGDNDGAHQPSVDVTVPDAFFGKDLSLNVWGSFPMNAGHEDAEELDYTLSLSKDIFDEMFNISEGYTYFDYPHTGDTADVHESWISFTLNKIPNLPMDIAATVFVGYDFAAASVGPDEGWYYSWGFSTEVPLPEFELFQNGQTLALGIVNWGNDGVANLKPSSLYATDLSVSTTYTFDAFSISPSLNYTKNHEEEINSGNDEFWGGITIGYAF